MYFTGLITSSHSTLEFFLFHATCFISMFCCCCYWNSGCFCKLINTLRLRQNGRLFPDNIFKCIFLNENLWISTKIPLKFVPKGPVNNILALVQIMAWRRPGDKPFSEPMLVSLLRYICITRPQWVNGYILYIAAKIYVDNEYHFISLCVETCLEWLTFWKHIFKWIFLKYCFYTYLY